MSSRQRVETALAHKTPDRTPVDFLAVPEIWRQLLDHFGIAAGKPGEGDYFDPAWEAVLEKLDVDCRVISFDQFCNPPAAAFGPKGRPEMWNVQSRSTPAGMWRWKTDDGFALDIFGRGFREVANLSGVFEENVATLSGATSLDEIKAHRWPDPDWWDFSDAKAVVEALNRNGEKHIRYRMGTIFELAWQMRGMEKFLMELGSEPEIPRYMMERITDVAVEVTRRALDAVGPAVDMVYFYDDLAANVSLLMSKRMWRNNIVPFHQKLIDVAHSCGKKVMYHTDGAVRPLIPDLIEMGVDVLNPIQPGVTGMEADGLKRDFGDRLSFHGGIDIVGLLPKGKPDEVRATARQMARLLGENGGYVMASSHHIQSDTPLANVLALYETDLR
jgi:uroporphyrinogen decarboxylase